MRALAIAVLGVLGCKSEPSPAPAPPARKAPPLDPLLADRHQMLRVLTRERDRTTSEILMDVGEAQR